MRKNLIKIFILIIFTFIIQGCTSTKYTINVNSYSTVGQVTGRKYFIQPEKSKLENKNLTFEVKEAEKYIDFVLSRKGYTKVNNIREADQFIVFDYNISGPYTYTRDYEEPVWDTVVYPRTRYFERDGRLYPYTHWERDYDIVGYRTRVRTYTYYTKTIQINSFNRDKTKSFWQVNGMISDSNSNIRNSLPFLIKGIENYIGTDSGQAVNIIVPSDDIDVELMKREVVNSNSIAPIN